MPAEQSSSILIAHHDERVRRAFSTVLQEAGYSVLHSATCEATPGLVAEERPDLVLLEVGLPGIGGLEVARRLREDPATAAIPILHLFPADTVRADIPRDEERWADGCLVEPVEAETLLTTVKALLHARRAEAEVVAAGQWRQAALDAARQGLCLLDREGRYLQCNQATLDLLGASREAVLGRKCHEFVDCPPELAAHCPFLRVQESRRRETVTLELRGRWVTFAVDPIWSPRGELDGAVLMMTDITESRAAEQEREELVAAREAEHALLQEVLRQMPSGVVIAEAPSGRLVSASQRTLQALRVQALPQDPVERFAVLQVTHLDGRPYAVEENPLYRALHYGEIVIGEELEVARGDGSRATLRVSAGPVRDEEGKTLLAVLSFQDITDRVEAERDLAREAALLSTIQEGTDNWLAYLDRELRYLGANSAYCQGTGLTCEEIIGRTFLQVFPDEGEIAAIFRRVLATGARAEAREFPRVLYHRPELGQRYLDFGVSPVKGERGEVEGVVVSVIDVTRQVQQREQLVEAERARAQLAETLNAEISHRVKNNLAMVAELLQMQIMAEPEPRVASVLTDTVSRLLNFADIHAQMGATHLEQVELVGAVRRIAGINRAVFASENVDMEVRGEPVHYPYRVATNLSVIINELITNAVRHGSLREDGLLCVVTDIRRTNGKLRISVWNSGNPVPPDFDPGKQRRLGLRLVWDLVVVHYGGTLTLRPYKDGTRAEITLPEERLRQDV